MHPQNVVFLGLGAVWLVFTLVVYTFNPWGWEFARRGREAEARKREMRRIVEAIRAASSIEKAVEIAEKVIQRKHQGLVKRQQEAS